MFETHLVHNGATVHNAHNGETLSLWHPEAPGGQTWPLGATHGPWCDYLHDRPLEQSLREVGCKTHVTRGSIYTITLIDLLHLLPYYTITLLHYYTITIITLLNLLHYYTITLIALLHYYTITLITLLH